MFHSCFYVYEAWDVSVCLCASSLGALLTPVCLVCARNKKLAGFEYIFLFVLAGCKEVPMAR